jgi:hypothetical protein
MRLEAIAAGTEKPSTLKRLAMSVATVRATLVRAAADWSREKA